MKIVAGLGNPGSRYAQTRHNAGFRVVEAIAAQFGERMDRVKFFSLTAEARIGGEKVLLMQPQTFMNLSGKAVGEAVSFFKAERESLLVVVDDVAINPGEMRFRASGSAGGHNGLKSVEQALGTDAYHRLRIGVGAPGAGWELYDHVLGRPGGKEQEMIHETEVRAAGAVEDWINDGIESCMNKYNGIGKDKTEDDK